MSNGERMPSPNNPMTVARIIAGEHHADDNLTLRHWRGGWMTWTGSYWVEAETASVRSELYKRMEGCLWTDQKGNLNGWLPNKTKIGNLLESLAAVVHLSETADTPSWIVPRAGDPGGQCVACTNGILAVGPRTLAPPTPRYFNTVAVPFEYAPGAPAPTRWLEFLDQLWPGDPDSVAALQEWFGYVLSGRTDLQKMLMLTGPTRSGKGTIARVLAQLVGNVAGPTLLSIASDFGLAPLLGKPLAIISDARLGKGNYVQTVVERLLSISGEDVLDVNRKYRDPWTGKLGTRLMLLSNELPQFADESGAIGDRFIVLSMTKSFLGAEDPRLFEGLLVELPGILEWALDGLDRLTGRWAVFTVPEASQDAVRVMRDLISPISAFVRDRCEVGPHVSTVDDIWAAWKGWAEDNGVPKSTKQWLGRSLRATVPSLRDVRLRDAGQRSRAYEGLRVVVDDWSAQEASGSAQDPFRSAQEELDGWEIPPGQGP